MQPTIEEQREFWDWHWEHRDERLTVNTWKDRRHEVMVAMLGSLRLRNPRILDVGCGTGFYTSGLARFGPTIGLDLSETGIAVARKEFPEIEFLAGNLYDYPFEESSFDVVVAQEVFDHVEDQPAFVERVAALLRPGGHLLVSCTNRFVLERVPVGTFPKQPDHHIGKYLVKGELKALLRPRFHVLRTTSVLPMGNRGLLRLVNSHRLNRALGAVLGQARVESLKENAGFGYQLIALCRRRP
jgi:2-polyprenyl-3-methyl-5-hydroxy-6-metoxy-1,4-benzoquinol methylase